MLAIDPGNAESAYCVYDTDNGRPLCWEKVSNGTVLALLTSTKSDALAIEMVASYGMAVGATVFETCVWSGRFIERWMSGRGLLAKVHVPVEVYRREVKLHLCGNARAKDGNIRQALIDRFGPKGTKAAPGPLYGMKADCWSALAVAVTAAETKGCQ
jgi:hypothetical protein